MLFTRSHGAKTLKTNIRSLTMLLTRFHGAKTLKTNIHYFTMLFTCSHGAKTLKTNIRSLTMLFTCSHVFFPSSSPHRTISWFGCSKWRNSTTSRWGFLSYYHHHYHTLSPQSPSSNYHFYPYHHNHHLKVRFSLLFPSFTIIITLIIPSSFPSWSSCLLSQPSPQARALFQNCCILLCNASICWYIFFCVILHFFCYPSSCKF